MKIQFFEPVAASLFSAAWCNLNCSYCYIPKSNPKFLLRIHNSILTEIKQNPNKFIERICKYYKAENLEVLSHWGTEPTLTFYEWYDFYKLALNKFPNIKTISFSSNFTTNIDKTVNLFKKIQELKPTINFDVQISLDGPNWVTDNNRGKGITNLILDNVYKFYELTRNLKVKNVKTHFKPTISPENIPEYLKNDRVYKYYEFFENILKRLRKYEHIKTLNNVSFTLVTHTNYTKEHGVQFNEIFKQIESLPKKESPNLDLKFNYYASFERLMRFYDEFYVKQNMFTCSAADSSFGITQKGLHACHDTYYYNIKGYHKLLGMTEKEMQMVANALICEDDDPSFYVYRNRSYHDFAKLRVGNAIAVILLLSKNGYISKVYNDYDMAKLLAEYVESRMNCYVWSYTKYKSSSIMEWDYYLVFGNGLFENFIRKYNGDNNYV